MQANNATIFKKAISEITAPLSYTTLFLLKYKSRYDPGLKYFILKNSLKSMFQKRKALDSIVHATFLGLFKTQEF